MSCAGVAGDPRCCHHGKPSSKFARLRRSFEQRRTLCGERTPFGRWSRQCSHGRPRRGTARGPSSRCALLGQCLRACRIGSPHSIRSTAAIASGLSRKRRLSVSASRFPAIGATAAIAERHSAIRMRARAAGVLVGLFAQELEQFGLDGAELVQDVLGQAYVWPSSGQLPVCRRDGDARRP